MYFLENPNINIIIMPLTIKSKPQTSILLISEATRVLIVETLQKNIISFWKKLLDYSVNMHTQYLISEEMNNTNLYTTKNF